MLLAVDVGTLSARAGVFDAAGALLASAAAPFPLHRPAPEQAVYRMDEIWDAVASAVRAALAAWGGGAPIRGMAFDATSSLVLTHHGPAPLAGDADVFCWADHRGEALAAEITATGDRLLDIMGGTMSPEMHLPKLLWLKRHAPDAWQRLTGARDLCDELARRATGRDGHSLCGLACKWAFLPHEGEGWRHALLQRLGLGDLLALGKLAEPPLPVGTVHGTLQPEPAARLGLPPGIPVAAGLIDAEAGTLGALQPGFAAAMNRTVVLVGGTSTCLMAFAPDARHIPGVWGPFHGAVFPGLWLHEAGQSATGAALDAVLQQHPAGPRRAGPAEHAEAIAGVEAAWAEPGFAAGRHLVPDWLGNRSPLGNGEVRALALGLNEERTGHDFLETYYATARAIALQVRQVLDHMDGHGYAIDRVVLSGGHARNRVLVRLYQDALGRTLTLPRAPEPVLLGTAMVAAVAAGLQPDLIAAVEAMGQGAEDRMPDPDAAAAHDIAFRIYGALFQARTALLGEIGALATRAPAPPPRQPCPRR